MRITLVSAKGGSGRSSLSYLLARALTQAGRAVAVEDLDPQRSLSHLLEDAEWLAEESPELTIVDTPPRINAPAVLAAIEEADRIVVPISPSPMELATLKATLEVVDDKRRKGTPALVVINRVRTGTALSNVVRSAIEETGAKVAATEVPERQSVQKAILGNWTTLEPPTRETILELALEILTATD